MSEYDDKLAASRAAWLAFCEAVDRFRDSGGDDDDVSEIADLWSAYVLARGELGGEY